MNYCCTETLITIHKAGVTHGQRGRSAMFLTPTAVTAVSSQLPLYVYAAGVQSGQNERKFLHLATRWALEGWLLADLVRLVLQYDA